MLEAIFGNLPAERVLLFLHAYEEGYARQIADTFGISLSVVHKQLHRLERGSVLVSRSMGRTRMFTWNPRYPLQAQLHQLLASAMEYPSDSEVKAYCRQRLRPHRAGKPF